MNRNGKKKMKRGLGVAYCTLIYLFLFLPIAVVAANSFNASTTKPYLSWKGFTLDWYVRLFDNGSLLEAFGNTMLIAAASTVLSTVIGTLGAVGMYRYKFRGKKTVETVVLLGRELGKIHEHVYLDYKPSKENYLSGGATYSEIKQWIQAEYGLKVSSLYIAQIKQKHGIIERECHNKSKNTKPPQCPPEKAAAIETALKHFKMI